MKQILKILVVIIISTVAKDLYSQENKSFQKDTSKKYTIVINENGALEKHYRVKHGSVVNLRVIGVNPRKLNSETKFEPFNFDYSLPKIAVDFFSEASSASDKASLEKIAFTLATLSDSVKNKKVEIGNLEKVYNEKIKLQQKGNSTRKNLSAIAILKQKQQALVEELKKAEELMTQLNSNIDVLKKEIDKIKSFDNQTSTFINANDNCTQLVSAINRYLLLYKGIDSIGNLNFIPNKDDFKALVENFLQAVTNGEATDGKSFTNKFNSLLSEFSKQFSIAANAYQYINREGEIIPVSIPIQLTVPVTGQVIKIDTIKVPVKNLKVYKEMFDNLKAINDKLTESANLRAMHKTIIEASVLYEELRKLDNSIITGLMDKEGKVVANPITDDIITVAPVIKNLKGELIKQIPSFNIHSYGKWKINISSGYMLSYVREDQFANYSDTTGINVGVRRGEQYSVIHSPGFLIHAYRTTKNDLTYGYAGGINLPIANQPLSFYLGLSLLCSEKTNRFVLSAGISIVQAQVLNKANLVSYDNVGDSYKYVSSATNREPVYDKIYKPTAFISITYNLSNLNK